MNTYVKIGDAEYTASMAGKMNDMDWDGRESKAITMTMDYASAAALFTEGTEWSIKTTETVTDSDGNETTNSKEYDNSAYSVAGDITIHRDGTVTVKTGKPTDLENALELLLAGGDANV